MMKRLFLFFVGMFPFLWLNSQCLKGFDVDTLYCVMIKCIPNQKEPKFYEGLLPAHESCYLNISDYDTLIKSLKERTYPISDFYFDLFGMIKASFPDSSDGFKKELYYASFEKWYLYNVEQGENPGQIFYLKTDEKFRIIISKVIAITKRNVNNYPLAVNLIKEVVPVYLNDKCIKNGVLEISETFMIER